MHHVVTTATVQGACLEAKKMQNSRAAISVQQPNHIIRRGSLKAILFKHRILERLGIHEVGRAYTPRDM